MEALEVGHFRRVAGLGQHLEARLHQRARAAAEHGLLAEKIGLGFLLEGRLDDAAARAADALGPGERDLLGLLAGVLVDRDERRHAFALGVLAAHDVAGAFRRDHDDVHIRRRDECFEMDGEAVAEDERLALGKVRADVLFKGRRLLGVGDGHEDHVRLFHGLAGVENLEAFFRGNRARLRAGIQPDDDFDARFLEVQRVRVALGTKAEHGAGFAFENGEIGVFVGVNFHGVGVWSG